MFESLYTTLQAFALAGGFWGVVVIGFAQEVIPPLPSTAVAMSLGFLLLTAGAPLSWNIVTQSIVLVGIPLAIGLTAGAVVIYYVLYWGGKPFVVRFGRYFGVAWSDVEHLEARMEGTSKDTVFFFVTRAVPFVPGVLLNVFAGIIRWPIGLFIVTTLAGTIVRGVLCALIGWAAGSAFMKYASLIEHTNTAIAVLAVVLVVGFIAYRRFTVLVQLKPIDKETKVE